MANIKTMCNILYFSDLIQCRNVIRKYFKNKCEYLANIPRCLVVSIIFLLKILCTHSIFLIFQDSLSVSLLASHLNNQEQTLGFDDFQIGIVGAVFTGCQILASPIIVSSTFKIRLYVYITLGL